MKPARLYLLGFMGAGKSTVGRQLAADVGWRFIDLDSEIEKTEVRSIKEIFADRGEKYFRKIETECLKNISELEPPLIVACGGGAVLAAENREIMRATGLPVYLHVSAAEALKRIGTDSRRPLLAGEVEGVKSLWKKRQKTYNSIDCRLDTEKFTPPELKKELKKLLAKKTEAQF